jgi:small subunit ribosomal protein S17
MEEARKTTASKTKKRTMEGEVVGTATAKTAIVRVKSRVLHPMYKKYFIRGRRYKVHDPESKCRIGDQVTIIECRPVSKEKKWMVHSIHGTT